MLASMKSSLIFIKIKLVMCSEDSNIGYRNINKNFIVWNLYLKCFISDLVIEKNTNKLAVL